MKTIEEILTEIKDHGKGIHPKDIKHIFKPFRKGNTKPLHGERSSGLGLAVVKKIVETHGGYIKVDSELLKGSTFTFALPIC